MKLENPALQRFATSLDMVDRLDLSDAFYGGRCEPVKSFCEVNGPDEQIEYSDVISLYPFIQKYSTFGVSHPDILMQDEIEIDKLHTYFGVIKVKVLAPEKLDLPVLPMRCNNKLYFALCKLCAQNMSPDPCSHTVEERQWVTTCHTLELQLAVSKGYKILEFFELWNYPENRRSKYSGEGTDESIFGSYISLFTRVKMESSGFPSHIVTDSQKDAYIQSIKNKEGVTLVKANVRHNPGMRYIAKLLLNSLWGKICQRSDMNTTKMFGEEDLGGMMKVLNNPAYTLNDFHIGEKTVSLTYKEKAGQVSDCNHSNVLLAATVTAAARCHLYSFMDTIPNELLYTDTDSCLWIKKKGKEGIKHGDNLGDMKSELPHGCFIRCLATCGAKSYSYSLSNGECVTRVKGFSLNHKNSQIINFASMKNMLCNNPNGSLETVNDAKIFRDRRHCKLYTAQETKSFTITNNKRVFFPDYSSKPYGYTE